MSFKFESETFIKLQIGNSCLVIGIVQIPKNTDSFPGFYFMMCYSVVENLQVGLILKLQLMKCIS